MAPGDLIAQIWECRDENCEANARLIAAAPELLEACKALISTTRSVLDEAYERGFPDCFRGTELGIHRQTLHWAQDILRKATETPEATQP